MQGIAQKKYGDKVLVGLSVTLNTTKVSGAKVGSILDIETIGIQEISTSGMATAFAPVMRTVLGEVDLLKK